jgi:ADP-ribosylglycohydrolase
MTTEIERAVLALEGLSIGDAFGQRFFMGDAPARARIAARELPPAQWAYTDDTVMARAIVDLLRSHETIDRGLLAKRFALDFVNEPHRGYGPNMHSLLRAIHEGDDWRAAAGALQGGEGSLGNGGAMRAGPIGAYFRGKAERVIAEATCSAEVTHAHPDGIAGAISVAFACHVVIDQSPPGGAAMLASVFEATPPGPTRDGLGLAKTLDFATSIPAAADALGSGHQLRSADTVPFALWCAARHLGSYEDTLWAAVEGLGDRDTTCAIAGAVAVCAAGFNSIPGEWLRRREPW